MKRLLCLFASLMLLCAPAFAESTDSLDDAVRKIFKVQKTVGGTVLVAKDGEIVYQLNYGYQNARKQLRVTDGTHFRIASVTKMVSAIRVMQRSRKESSAWTRPWAMRSAIRSIIPTTRAYPSPCAW